jgi:cytochrome c
MKTFLVTILALTLLAGTTNAQSKKDVEGWVKKAIEFYKSVGQEKAFQEFNNPKGKFSTDKLYITVDGLDGTCLSHGANVKMIGKDWSDLKDADGKAFIKERLEIVKKTGKGWQTYKWTNPVSKQIEVKSTYLEKVDNVIFTCGVYGLK